MSISSSRGQAEKEFRVEVEAIGHVRHKNLVRLLGYCIEGTHRYFFFINPINSKIILLDLCINFSNEITSSKVIGYRFL